MLAALALLFAYAFASNVAIAVLPHEPAVIAAGGALGVGPTVAAATLATVLAGWADYALFAAPLRRRAEGARRRLGRAFAWFSRAPFAILVGASLTPLPYWPFKALALASGYPRGRYLLALGLGRAARYALLAGLGHALDLPPWASLGVGLTGLAALALFGRGEAPSPTETTMSDDPKAQRVTHSLTRDWERAHLPRIARALPGWVTPDMLTGLGIAAAGAIGGAYVLAHHSRWWLLLVPLGLFVHWFGDSLDGTLARVREVERERYGYYVDRTADAISTVVIGVGFGLSPYVHLWVAMLMTIGYLLLMLYAEILAYTSGRFPLSFGRFGPTEARIGLGLFTLALLVWTPPTFTFGAVTLSAIDLTVLAAAIGLVCTFLQASLREARRLDRMDRARWQPLTSSGFTVAVDDEEG